MNLKVFLSSLMTMFSLSASSEETVKIEIRNESGTDICVLKNITDGYTADTYSKIVSKNSNSYDFPMPRLDPYDTTKSRVLQPTWYIAIAKVNSGDDCAQGTQIYMTTVVDGWDVATQRDQGKINPPICTIKGLKDLIQYDFSCEY